MKSERRCLSVVLVLGLGAGVLGACGSKSFCERAAANATRNSECYALPDGGSLSTFDTAKCETGLASDWCTASDRSNLAAVEDCYEKIPPCTKAMLVEYGERTLACVLSVQDGGFLSGACAKAIISGT